MRAHTNLTQNKKMGKMDNCMGPKKLCGEGCPWGKW